jgi:hypothetical protein
MDYDQDKYPMIWKRVSRAGYCFTYRIPCRPIRKTGKRVTIAALLAKGGERIHHVKPESLEHSPCECFGECRALERLDQPKTVILVRDDGRSAIATLVEWSLSTSMAALIPNAPAPPDLPPRSPGMVPRDGSDDDESGSLPGLEHPPELPSRAPADGGRSCGFQKEGDPMKTMLDKTIEDLLDAERDALHRLEAAAAAFLKAEQEVLKQKDLLRERVGRLELIQMELKLAREAKAKA